MTGIEFNQGLVRLGLQQYEALLLQSGYHDWHHICHISEAEFAAMGIKLGHRRKLQREAARMHSWPDHKALPVNKSICCFHRKGGIVASEFQRVEDMEWNWFNQFLVDVREQ